MRAKNQTDIHIRQRYGRRRSEKTQPVFFSRGPDMGRTTFTIYAVDPFTLEYVPQATACHRKLPIATESCCTLPHAAACCRTLPHGAPMPAVVFAHLRVQRAPREQGKTWRRRPRSRSRPPQSHLGVRQLQSCHPARAGRAPRIERRRRRPDHAPEASKTSLE